MSNLSPYQIGQVAYAAGFRGAGLRNAIAVALAESGGNPRNVHVNSDRWRSRDRGLWQINDHWHANVSDATCFSPLGCANAAYDISHHGADWSAWSTWHDGRAQAEMPRAVMAASQAARSPAAKAAGIGADPLMHLPQLLTLGAGGVVAGPGPANIGNDLAKGLGIAAGVAVPPIGLAELATGSTNPVQAITAPVLGVKDAAVGAYQLAASAGAWISDSHNWARVALVAGGSVAVLLSLEMIAKSGAAGSTAGAAAGIPGKAAKAALLA